MKKNEPDFTEDDIKVPNLARKYSKVGSKIRSEIEKDKKIFNLIKAANDQDSENNSNITNIKTNINSRQTNTKNSENIFNNSNRNRLDSQSDSEKNSNRKNNHMMSTRAYLGTADQDNLEIKKERENFNQPGNKAATSLEDRLNGLTRKISEVEKKSKFR